MAVVVVMVVVVRGECCCEAMVRPSPFWSDGAEDSRFFLFFLVFLYIFLISVPFGSFLFGFGCFFSLFTPLLIKRQKRKEKEKS